MNVEREKKKTGKEQEKKKRIEIGKGKTVITSRSSR